MDPFYKRAQFLCEIGPYLYEPQSWTTENTPPLPFDPNNVVSLIAQHSPPTLFGEVYREQILKAENIKTFLFSNVVEIDLDKSGKRVTGVKIACLTGNKFFLKSGLVILSTGGLENPRILLLSNSVQKSGIGNQNDIVGRYFMEHIFVTKSARVLTQKSNISLEFYKEHVVNNIMLVAGISISPKNQNKEKLVNFGTRIEKIKKDTDTPKDKSIHSFDHLIQFLRRGDIPSNFLEHLGNIIADIDDVAVHAYRKIFPPNDVWEISYHAEQAPNPSSRVTLIREKDALGKNKIQLDWRLLDLDKYSIQRAHELLGMELGRAGLGRIEIIYDEEDFPGGNHHIGTTRLHNNPQKGVVDMNCKVHGVSNLFIAGSSVFPTSGCSPPTLTIVALALRLGDHVKNIMTKTGAP
jgi:choline dehydrogenase-like flavoprotein